MRSKEVPFILGETFYGIVYFNGSGKFAIYTIHIQCGKLVDFNY